MSKPLKDVCLHRCSGCKALCIHPDNIRSAVEYFKAIQNLPLLALCDHKITTEEFNYWMETLIYEEAFEDVMK